MKQGIYIVVENKMLTPTTYRMRLAGDVSAITMPGQFINIRLDGHFLRRPISVCDVLRAEECNCLIPENEDFPSNAFFAGADEDTLNRSFVAGENADILSRSLDTGESGNGIVTIIYKVLGHGTEEMTRFAPGKTLDILTGLGNGYDLSVAGERPLLIGGGVGIPPLYLAARRLIEGNNNHITDDSDRSHESAERGIPGHEAPGYEASVCEETVDRKPEIGGTGRSDVTVILGFNNSSEMYYVDEFEKLGCRVVIATADGSAGVRGFVTDAFRELSHECGSQCLAEAGLEAEGDSDGDGDCAGDEFTRFTHFYTCGPEPMLRAVYNEVYKEAGISGQMSFEERMGCGFGACMGCSCRTVTGYKRICKDGPVLRTEEILW